MTIQSQFLQKETSRKLRKTFPIISLKIGKTFYEESILENYC